jgi:hypothetical protein
MAWYEKVQEWELILEKNSTAGTSRGVKGQGVRVFAEVGTGAALNQPLVSSLPELGDVFIDPADTAGDYSNIKLTKIQYNRTHAACGAGKTATCTYTSKDNDDDTFGSFTGGLRVETIEAASDWAWFTDNNSTGDTGLSDVSKMYGRVDQDLPFYIANGTFSKRVIKSDNEFEGWREELIKIVGCINSTAYEGFNVGQVLLQTFSATKRFNEFAMAEWAVDIEFAWQVIRDVTMGSNGHDDWQFLPVSKYVNGREWARPVLVTRSEGMGIVQADQFIYPYADFSSITAD